MSKAELVALVAGREATINNAMARFAAGAKDLQKAMKEKTKDFRAFVGFVLHPSLQPTNLNLSTDQTFQTNKPNQQTTNQPTNLNLSNLSNQPNQPNLSIHPNFRTPTPQPPQNFNQPLFSQPKLQPTKASSQTNQTLPPCVRGGESARACEVRALERVKARALERVEVWVPALVCTAHALGRN
jgi:hypothetical protein